MPPTGKPPTGSPAPHLSARSERLLHLGVESLLGHRPGSSLPWSRPELPRRGRQWPESSAAIRLSYLRFATPIQFQYQWKTWGLWAHFGPTLAALVQSDYVYQGDSLPSHNRYAPEIIQNTLNYLALSTDPEDQLILMRLYRRWNWGFVLAGGVKSRLAPGVWTLALIGYHRTFTDAEAKNFRLSPESPPTYHPERKPTYLQLLSLQLGLVYEIERTPAP